eukprot:7007183-Prymnesium_polylepis.1
MTSSSRLPGDRAKPLISLAGGTGQHQRLQLAQGCTATRGQIAIGRAASDLAFRCGLTPQGRPGRRGPTAILRSFLYSPYPSILP